MNEGAKGDRALDRQRVVLNGVVRDVAPETTVAALLVLLDLPRERVAVEVDGEIVRKAAYDSFTLRPDARVEVVSFVGGG